MKYSDTTYRRLGDYIREVDVRNRNLQCNNLLGLSIAKTFIPSIANTIGTDMTKYKVISCHQFAYVADTSRRGDKIGIALYSDSEQAILSSIYTIFEVTDAEVILPEYLMLWFRRPEFDCYARFHSHGSAREVFDWSEMCDVQLPVPPIEEQRAVVALYQAIERCIEQNSQTIAGKSQYTDAFMRADIMAQMQFDIIIILSKFHYPPVGNNYDEVYKKSIGAGRELQEVRIIAKRT